MVLGRERCVVEDRPAVGLVLRTEWNDGAVLEACALAESLRG
jgi:hypothetical protein